LTLPDSWPAADVVPTADALPVDPGARICTLVRSTLEAVAGRKNDNASTIVVRTVGMRRSFFIRSPHIVDLSVDWRITR
jgi:hypothetical protein